MNGKKSVEFIFYIMYSFINYYDLVVLCLYRNIEIYLYDLADDEPLN